MSHIWALVIILVAFGVVGRIDYEAALVTAQLSAERRLATHLAPATFSANTPAIRTIHARRKTTAMTRPPNQSPMPAVFW